MKAGSKRPRPDGRLSDLVHSIEHNADRLSALYARDKQLDAAVADLAVLSRILFRLRDLEEQPGSGGNADPRPHPHVFAEPVLLPSSHLGTSQRQPFLRCCLHVGVSQHPQSNHYQDSRCIPLVGMDVERHRLAVCIQMEPHVVLCNQVTNPGISHCWRISHTISFKSAQNLDNGVWACDVPLDLQTTPLPLRATFSLAFLLPSDGTLVALPIPIADAVVDLLHFASTAPLRMSAPFHGMGLPIDSVERHIAESFSSRAPSSLSVPQPAVPDPPPPPQIRAILRLRMSRPTRLAFFALLFGDSALGSTLVTSADKLVFFVPNPLGSDRDAVHVSLYLTPIAGVNVGDAKEEDLINPPSLHDVTLTVTASVLAAVVSVKRAVTSRIAEWLGGEEEDGWERPVPRLQGLAVELELDRLARETDGSGLRVKEEVVALESVVEEWIGPLDVKGPSEM